LLRTREQLVHITDSALDVHERCERDRQTGSRRSQAVRPSHDSPPRHSISLPPLSGDQKQKPRILSDTSTTSRISSSQDSHTNNVSNTRRKSKMSELALAKRRIALIRSKRLEQT
uniref:Shugoshin_C domain-containing protein n=1 Tax=Echinostoma caproni TaxID=27848 RepID=A0A183AUJ9_9TREM